MLVIQIPDQEFFDSEKNEFTYVPACKLKLEHSLLSISKWETKWKKPFLTNEKPTPAEFIDYVKCMTINQDVPDSVYDLLGYDNIRKIEAYIMDPATASKVYDMRKGNGRKPETPTSELIYYWMVSNGIPFECEKWHLNRLLTLIKVCSIKNASPKKRSQRDIMRRNSSINAARRKQYNTRG